MVAPDQPLEVCLVAPMPPPYGGIANWTRLIVHHAATRREVRLRVVDIASRWRAVHDLSLWKRVVGGGLQALRDIGRFAWNQVHRRPDVVHLTTSGQLGVLRDIGILLVARVFGTPVVYHLRFGRVPDLARANTAEWKLVRRALLGAARILAIDARTEEAIRTFVPGARVSRIPNCIDLADLPDPVESIAPERTVVYVGWVVPSKGVGVLVEAWALLRPAGWRLVIVGPGDPAYRAELLASSGVDGVTFAGELPHEEALAVMAEADIVVLPSFTEGFPNVVLEAMALGKPVVASAVGAVPEMLRDGAGSLVTPGRADELSAGLSRLMSDAEMRRSVGSRARARAVSEYALPAVFARYVELWRSFEGQA